MTLFPEFPNIPVSRKTLQIIADALQAAQNETEAFFADKVAPCCKGQTGWTFRYQFLSDGLDPQLYIIRSFFAGPWPYLLILERATGALFLFLREDRLKYILSKAKNSSHHYSKVPALANRDLDLLPRPFEQLSMYPMDPPLEIMHSRETEFKQILQAFPENAIRNYIILTFSPTRFGLRDYRAILVNSRFEILADASLNPFLRIAWKEEDVPDDLMKIYPEDSKEVHSVPQIDDDTSLSLKNGTGDRSNGNSL